MILLDINVLLDVLQKREPHYRSSAAVIAAIVRGEITGALAAHAMTTVHYLVARYRDQKTANHAVSWLLRHFTIAAVGQAELLRASGLAWADFEDAVVAAAAESSGCEAIVTRNVKDFRESPVVALTPDEYLLSR